MLELPILKTDILWRITDSAEILGYKMQIYPWSDEYIVGYPRQPIATLGFIMKDGSYYHHLDPAIDEDELFDFEQWQQINLSFPTFWT